MKPVAFFMLTNLGLAWHLPPHKTSGLGFMALISFLLCAALPILITPVLLDRSLCTMEGTSVIGSTE